MPYRIDDSPSGAADIRARAAAFAQAQREARAAGAGGRLGGARGRGGGTAAGGAAGGRLDEPRFAVGAANRRTLVKAVKSNGQDPRSPGYAHARMLETQIQSRALRQKAEALDDAAATLRHHLTTAADAQEAASIAKRLDRVASRAQAIKSKRQALDAGLPHRVTLRAPGAFIRGSPEKSRGSSPSLLRRSPSPAERRQKQASSKAYADQLRAQVKEREAWRALNSPKGDLGAEARARKQRSSFLAKHNSAAIARVPRYAKPVGVTLESQPQSQAEIQSRAEYRAILDDQRRERARAKARAPPPRVLKAPPHRLQEPHLRFVFKPPPPDPNMPRIPKPTLITKNAMARREDRRPPWDKSTR